MDPNRGGARTAHKSARGLPTVRKCKNFNIAYEFLSQHKWPEKLSDKRFDRCYCESCHPKDLEDTCIIGGRTYVVPRGYTRIGVHIDEQFADHHKIWDTWNNCYHGTTMKSAISIIENRGPVLPGEQTIDGVKVGIRDGHIRNMKGFFTTPTIKYAELPTYASWYDFKSPSDGKTYHITVVMQLKQKPGSFEVQKETVGAGSKRFCPYIKNEEIEWKSERRTAIVPYGVLLRIEDVGKQVNKRLTTKLSIMRPLSYKLYDSLLATYKDSVQVECPHCKHLNDWVNPSESQGIILTCESIFCRIKFKPLRCPKCIAISAYCDCFSRFNNERFFICENSKCKEQLLSRKCPHCSVGFNFCKEPYANQIVPVKCSEIKCQKNYQVFMCPHCKQLENGKADVRGGAVSVTCNNDKCLKKYQLAKCTDCSNVNVYLNAGLDGTVKCAYKGCNAKFKQPLPSARTPVRPR